MKTTQAVLIAVAAQGIPAGDCRNDERSSFGFTITSDGRVGFSYSHDSNPQEVVCCPPQQVVYYPAPPVVYYPPQPVVYCPPRPMFWHMPPPPRPAHWGHHGFCRRPLQHHRPPPMHADCRPAPRPAPKPPAPRPHRH